MLLNENYAKPRMALPTTKMINTTSDMFAFITISQNEIAGFLNANANSCGDEGYRR